ncbi:FixH family protein [Imhoffiella purpurea]|uniref:Type cbb3 cytochrome oxidase biogenesis protein CcoH n=1 Tax=Imhoffiella purpurea TaxID=1249627 RepID=W9W2Q9_9GAMM|nr:FixH family protein [Imhoffiella purpurea]EXJ16835.1 hypothetical protein D779_2446 [Imhoffiella purpurea]
MTTHTPSTDNAPFRNPWVIGWIGLVATVLAVNILMVYLAFETSPGLVNADYYERGQYYENTLVSKRARSPNWAMRADIPDDLIVGEQRPIRFFLVDKAGQPVDAESVTLYVYRPSDAARDFSLPMTREGRGRYVARASFPLMGIWDTLIAVRSGEDEYSLSQRVNVGGL